MSDESQPIERDLAGPAEPPAFDKEAARRRYRAQMRGPFMRSMYVLLALVVLAAWGLGIASVWAKDVERLPDHDLGVPPSRCVTCHAERRDDAPAMPHVAFPSCGFCHRQGLPPRK
ncbi:MAG TPA: hypothetical protein VF897_00850 [Roseiflexaceae bacterium]